MRFVLYRIGCALVLIMGLAVTTATAADTLTLEQILDRVLTGHPSLQALQGQRAALFADLRQAGRQPNPALELEVENIGLDSANPGFRASEVTVAIAQELPPASRRRSAEQLVHAQTGLLQEEQRQQQLRLTQEAKDAFLAVLAEQNRVALRHQQLSLSREVSETVHRRVVAGKDPGIEEDKARLQEAFAELEMEQAVADHEQAWRRLSGLWGKPESSPLSVSGSMEALPVLPDEAMLQKRLVSHPQVRWWKAQKEALFAQTAVARSHGKTQPKLGAGVRRQLGGGDTTLLVSLAWPLLWRDRNRDAVQAARWRAQASTQEQEAFLRLRRTELQQRVRAFRAKRDSALRLQTKMLPSAQATYRAYYQGYLQGKLTLLETLDSQRTLFQVHEQLLEARWATHEEWLAIEALCPPQKKENKP